MNSSLKEQMQSKTVMEKIDEDVTSLGLTLGGALDFYRFDLLM